MAQAGFKCRQILLPQPHCTGRTGVCTRPSLDLPDRIPGWHFLPSKMESWLNVPASQHPLGRACSPLAFRILAGARAAHEKRTVATDAATLVTAEGAVHCDISGCFPHQKNHSLSLPSQGATEEEPAELTWGRLRSGLCGPHRMDTSNPSTLGG